MISGLGASTAGFLDLAAPPEIVVFLLTSYYKSMISGLGASTARFLDLAKYSVYHQKRGAGFGPDTAYTIKNAVLHLAQRQHMPSKTPSWI